jgi:general secretion pathway protein D
VDMGDGQKAMTITSDDESNALVIYSTPQQYRIVEDARHKLDVRPLQVMIEATIGEVTLTDELQYGLQWFFRQGKHSAELGEGKTNALVQNFPGFSYMFSEANTNVVLNALTSLTTVNVLSSPELFVLNNHTASLQVGDEVPITTASAVSTDTSSAPLVNSVEYRDTGVILKVTPRVNDSGLVLLDIAQEVSDVATTDTSNIDSPTIQQRRIASSVAVQDGQTIVLGGLIKDNRSDTKAGLPFLRDLPGIGELFGSRDKTHDRTELIVLLTPKVVRNPIDVQALTDELERKLPAAAPLVREGRSG